MSEPQYRSDNRRLRPFAASAGVRARGCSRLLRRAVTDLGADLPYAKVMDKLVEHYGIVLGESTIRKVTLTHAADIHRRSGGFAQGLPEPVVAKGLTFIAEIDGTMVPTVRSDAASADRRKAKTVQWQEAKVSLAHAQGSTQMVYGATLLGDVDTAGSQLRALCQARRLWQRPPRARRGRWRAVDCRAGQAALWQPGHYLLDFYHVCEYLSDASKAIEQQPQTQQAWLDVQKQRLKEQQPDAVLHALHAHLEPAQTDDEQAPVRRCHRYLSQRLHQLDYRGAIDQGLPIGSGEIESAHRYLVQKRLKLPGAWWLAANADHMLALRVNRANGEWADYWATDYRYVA